MTKDIAGFLEIIPAIDRCAEVARDGGPLAEIYNVRFSHFSATVPPLTT
jgi:hypothetical protein